MMKKLLVVLSIAAMIFFMAPQVAAYEPVYNSEGEAIQAETERLIENRYKPGSYPVTITYQVNGVTMTKEVMVTIKSDDATVVGNIVIDAQPFTMTVAEARNFTDEQWVDRAQVYAWQTDTGTQLPIAIVDHSQVAAKPGKYSVVFGANAEITIQVQATVVDTATPDNTTTSNTNAGWFETYYEPPPDQLFPEYGTTFFEVLKVSTVFMLLLPLLFLIIQYLWTSKAMKEVLVFISKRSKKRE